MGIFDAEALQRAVTTELDAVPAGQRGALIGYYTLDGRWKAVVVTRIGEHWSLGAMVEKDLATGIQGGIIVRGTW